MMIQILFFLFWVVRLSSSDYDLEKIIDRKVVLSTKQIVFPDFPGAFNPSLFKIDEGYVFVFRYSPNVYWDPWVNYMCVALLNDSFELISGPDILSTGLNTGHVKSQAEDPRVFSYQNRLYLIYSDNIEVNRPWYRDRRDMYIAELHYERGHFSLTHPLKLVYEKRYQSQYWQKNWTPFEWEGKLLCGYTVNPHEIMYLDLTDGSCYPCYETKASLDWPFGVLRGSSCPLFVDGEYLSFFHSGHQMKTNVSSGEALWHYFMGAYTFSSEPPFHLTKISSIPLVGDQFYEPGWAMKKVILPGGFIVEGSKIFVAYGKNDEEMWIAELDKEALMQSLSSLPLMDP